MGANSNKKKNEQLGMPYGTATNRLRKRIMFQLIQETGRDICFQCDAKILDVDDMSVDHKEPWLNSANPVERFFDLANIAFSHLGCNCSASTGVRPKSGCGATGYRNGCRCRMCKDAQAKRMRKYRSKIS